MKQTPRILIVDDDRDILQTASMALKTMFPRIEVESNPGNLLPRISREDFDLIILDMNFRKGLDDGKEGFYWLERILEYNSEQVVILITAYGEVDTAVKAIKMGATDFILKPWKNQKLIATVNSAIELSRSRRETGKYREAYVQEQKRQHGERGMLGNSREIEQVREVIRQVADTDASILITGENGTGKDLVARSIHEQSSREDRVFVRADLGALSESLFESELFGHVKGAFTDASHARTGRFQLADGGTLFLDEIGNIKPAQQQKLLSVLQNSEVTPVGANEPLSVDVRIISATNADIAELVANGAFREDLYYRLNTVEVKVPPLRERGKDIILLAEHFTDEFCRHYHKDRMEITPDIAERLLNYYWPGNVRELRHLMERAVILSSGESLNSTVLSLDSKKDNGSWSMGSMGGASMAEMERSFILQSLKANDNNVTRTAEQLGLSRMSLYRRMKKHGISN